MRPPRVVNLRKNSRNAFCDISFFPLLTLLGMDKVLLMKRRFTCWITACLHPDASPREKKNRSVEFATASCTEFLTRMSFPRRKYRNRTADDLHNTPLSRLVRASDRLLPISAKWRPEFFLRTRISLGCSLYRRSAVQVSYVVERKLPLGTHGRRITSSQYKT